MEKKIFLLFLSYLSFWVHTVWVLLSYMILFAVIKTLRVSYLDTPSFDTPVVTELCEGVRQKILILQVFNRCVIVWDKEGVLSCIPHLPYPGEVLGREFPKRYIYLLKKSWKKDGETPHMTGSSGQGEIKKIEFPVIQGFSSPGCLGLGLGPVLVSHLRPTLRVSRNGPWKDT